MVWPIQKCLKDEKSVREGVKALYPGLYIDSENGIIMLNRNRKNRVALLCGAKASYQPFGAGFVGEGMLTGYIEGGVDTPPSTKTITKVIHNLAKLNSAGILVLLLNYPVQVLNFGLAIEKARLKGIMIECFVITDDCSRTEDVELVGYEKNLAMRRGLSGCAYVFKILGSMSSLGCKLTEILDHAMTLNFRLATIGFAIKSCTLPGSDKPLFQIPKGEAVVGCGLQGDRGVYNIQVENLSDFMKKILPKAIKQSGLRRGDNCCIFVNNLGSVTTIELYCIANEIDICLGKLGICIERLYVGTVMTYHNTKGALISVLNSTYLPEWVRYLDMNTEAYAWPGSRLSRQNPKWPTRLFGEGDENLESSEIKMSIARNTMILNEKEAQLFKKCLTSACEAVINAEDVINRLNGITGNGDCGTNMKTFSDNLLKKLQDMPCKDVAETFYSCSSLAEEMMSGTIGILYSLGFNGAGTEADCWVSCWESAINQIMKYTSAKPGYRTLLDALVPAYEIFVDWLVKYGPDKWDKALARAVQYAECGCIKTVTMKPKVGRAKYVSQDKINNMDAGAYGVLVWLQAVYNTLQSYLVECSSLEAQRQKSTLKSIKSSKMG